MLWHHPCRCNIWRIVFTDTESMEFLSLLFKDRLQQNSDYCTIKTTTQEETKRYITHTLSPYSFIKCFLYTFSIIDWTEIWLLPLRIVVFNKARLRSPEMSSWELFNGFAILVHNALKLWCKPKLSVLSIADIERFDSAMISGGNDILSIVRCQDDAKNSIQFSHKVVAKFLIKLNNRLRIWPGSHFLKPVLLFQSFMIINFSVCDEGDRGFSIVIDNRLLATFRVHDGKSFMR